MLSSRVCEKNKDEIMAARPASTDSPADSSAVPSAAPRGDLAGRLIAWYERHRRVLPWRAPAGERPDPYRVWLS